MTPIPPVGPATPVSDTPQSLHVDPTNPSQVALDGLAKSTRDRLCAIAGDDAGRRMMAVSFLLVLLCRDLAAGRPGMMAGLMRAAADQVEQEGQSGLTQASRRWRDAILQWLEGGCVGDPPRVETDRQGGDTSPEPPSHAP